MYNVLTIRAQANVHMPEQNVVAHHRGEVTCRALVGQFILKQLSYIC